MSDLRVGVVGAGYFGRLHAMKVAASPRCTLSGVADADPGRAAAIATEFAAPAMPYPDLLAASDAVVIAAPAAAHFALASEALRAGKHVLVEKPIAATLAEADALAALATTHRLVLQVGHLLRYTPEHAAIRARMPNPLYIDCIRIAPFKPRGTDVSVVLDLMIHDLDFVFSLVDSPVLCVAATGAPVASPLDDIATARIGFENGCIANITASRVALKTERKMRLFSQSTFLSVDFAACKLIQIARGPGTPIPQLEGAALQEFTWQPDDALAAEHAAFAAAILENAPILVDAAAGRRALAGALAVVASIGEQQARARAGGLLA